MDLNPFQIFISIIATFAGLGLAVAGCGYGYSSFKAGKNKYKDELITDLKATVAQKEARITELDKQNTDLIANHQKQLEALRIEISKLQNELGKQEGKLKTYESLLENRDPKMIEMLSSIKIGIDSLNAHQVKSEKQTKQVAVTLEQNNR